MWIGIPFSIERPITLFDLQRREIVRLHEVVQRVGVLVGAAMKGNNSNFRTGAPLVTDFDARSSTVLPTGGLVMLTHVIYGLHAFSAVAGLVGTMLIVTAFLTGWPSLIAVILNYVKRSDVRGTFLESHFRWQIRTFWFALLWVVAAWLFVLTFIGIPIAMLIFAVVGLWVLYRIIRGWLALLSERAMPMP
jgi:uncharacterized membrane protein